MTIEIPSIIGNSAKATTADPGCFGSSKRRSWRNRGFTLVELVLAIAIFATISAGVVAPIVGTHLSNLDEQRAFQANALLNESWEAVRSIRNRDWAELQDGDHGLVFADDRWILSGNSDIQDGLTRVISLSTPQRDALGNLVDGGGTDDPDTKRATLSLTWSSSYSEPRTLTAVSLITHFKDPGAWPIPVPVP